jgi:hypothetical protein
MALAAAMQWTTSDEPLVTVDRGVSRIEPVTTSTRDAVEPVVRTPMAAPKLEPGPAKPSEKSSRVPALPSVSDRSIGAAQPMPEPVTEIHIGSVDVQIVPTTPPAPPPAAATPAIPSTSSTPLARGFTSRFGLRQS